MYRQNIHTRYILATSRFFRLTTIETKYTLNDMYMQLY